MSKPLIHDDFLLQSPAARRLYHDYAESMPIIDYHCHLPPAQVAEDARWDTLTQIWLGGDHYKWRTMRSNGVDERYCTGDADDWEKFRKFAETMPQLLRNPMYHWCHLELARYFDLDDVLLGPDTAREIYDHCNTVLQKETFSARQLMRQSRVALVCTTDDPIDNLQHHQAIAAEDDFDVQVLPTWRPDKGMAAENVAGFNAWVDALAEAAKMDIADFESYLTALDDRHAFFHEVGCRLSDHGLDTLYADDYALADIQRIFRTLRSGQAVSAAEVSQFKSAMMYEFALMDASRNWTQQIHYGALRNNNRRLFEQLGPDVGCDSIGDWPVAEPMSRFFGRLDAEDKLPRTIIYNLNPRDNELIATMIGNFQQGPTPGKMQFGSGWWFLDQMDGMKRQIEALSQLGLLGRFVGMLTDSRSFLSYARHEYFRRILCNILGGEMETGLLPTDFDLIGNLVKNASYNNAANYFGFDLEPVV